MTFVYYLILKPLSYLPLSTLYFLSDFLFFLFYKILGYRKEVVLGNLRRSFPQKTEKEIKLISRRFYHHFCDLLVEAIRIFSIPKKEAIRRCILKNPGLFQDLFQKGKNLILVGGHYNNWEMLAVALDVQIPHQTYGLYKPLTNKFMNHIMLKSRQKYGLILEPTKNTKSVFQKEHGRPFACIFGADQSPTTKKAYWMPFLNQETAIAFGTEKYAQDFDAVVVYGAINKVSRGYYQMDFTVLESIPKISQYGSITQKHTLMLERQILKDPANWTWTHKRWKLKRKENEKLHPIFVDLVK